MRSTKKFSARRHRNWVMVIACAGLLLLANFLLTVSLRRAAVASGWLLLALLVFLAAYNARKKITFFPLGSSSTWLQCHIYAGVLTAIVFGLHVSWRLPDGVFERALAALYVVVFASGLLGLFISRAFAQRLTTRGGEVIFERIPAERARIQADVERLVLECLSSTKSTAVPEFYDQHLKPFFDRPRHLWAHLWHGARPPRQLLDEIQQTCQFLNAEEQRFMNQIARQVQSKEDLDYHQAHQALLKYWLFAHVPLTYALMVFAVGHILLVYAFSGGFR